MLAEELTSITFEKAWISRKKYKRDLGAFQFWMFGIAQKVAADHFRKGKNEIPLDAVNPLSSQKVEKVIKFEG